MGLVSYMGVIEVCGGQWGLWWLVLFVVLSELYGGLCGLWGFVVFREVIGS